MFWLHGRRAVAVLRVCIWSYYTLGSSRLPRCPWVPWKFPFKEWAAFNGLGAPVQVGQIFCWLSFRCRPVEAEGNGRVERDEQEQWITPTCRRGEAGMRERVRITQIDGSLPNLALMRLSAWHREQGHEVYFTRNVERDLLEPEFDTVYGSAIFAFSAEKVRRLATNFPGAIIGGTGSGSQGTVEQIIGEYQHCDYSIYPEFDASIGFTQRGCRLSCKFCVVPTKEGKPRSVRTIAELWRGQPYPKKLHLLDNDFFGNPEWRNRIAEIRDGGFRVCLSQGINVRMITTESAEALASIEYRNTKFSERVLYTAWDNLKDETVFFRGVDCLEKAGVPPKHVRAYMLIGFDPAETWERLWHRFNRMVERGIEPYPMVYDRSRKDLVCFQRWVITGLYRCIPWKDYDRSTKSQESVDALTSSPCAAPCEAGA